MKGKELEKKAKYYIEKEYLVEFHPDKDEGGYVVKFPDLPGCLTVGETLEEAVQMAEEAKESWIYATLEGDGEIPEPTYSYDYSGQFKLRIPKELHADLAEAARKENVSMNQYCMYLLAKHNEIAKENSDIKRKLLSLLSEIDKEDFANHVAEKGKL